LSSIVNPCPIVTEFIVQIQLVDMCEHRPLYSIGYDCVMHTHTAEIEVTCVELISVIDKNGVAVRKPFALQGQRCIVRLQTPLHTCMERYDDVPALGRLTLRDEGRTIAIGKITEFRKTA
jgi:peptide chain release factor subunit 3